MKNLYMVPFGQDNPKVKANSVISKPGLILETVLMALEGKQLQPVLISY
jgi:dipicolinate synthase subunit B